ncbi:hypothetical protein RCL1_004803 [Eukaryota sp. TZLM3-RCL]
MNALCLLSLICIVTAYVHISRPLQSDFLPSQVQEDWQSYLLTLSPSTFLLFNGHFVNNFFLYNGFHIISEVSTPAFPRSSFLHLSTCISFDSRFFLDTSTFPDSNVHFAHHNHLLTDISNLDTLLVAFQFSSSQSNNQFNQFSFKLISFINFNSSNLFESIVDNEILTLNIPAVTLNQDESVIANLIVLDVPIYCKGNFPIEVHFLSLISCSFCISSTGLIDVSYVRILTAALAPHLFVDSYVLFFQESSSLILLILNSKLRIHDYDNQKSIEFSSPLSNVKAVTHVYSGTSFVQFLLFSCLNSNCQFRMLTVEFTPNDLESDLNVVVLSAGEAHSAAVLADGTVKTWGSGANGRTGHGDTVDRSIPATVNGIVDAVQVACGGSHTLVLRRNRQVLGFGVNTNGQIGDNTKNVRMAPTPTHGLTQVVSISAGTVHSVALKSDGTVWSWGANSFFQLGRTVDETISNDLFPVEIPNITGAKAIVAGDFHTLVVKSDGSVVSFGHNNQGQLGNGHNLNHQSIQNCGSFSSAVNVAAGSAHSLILLANGDLWATGRNTEGELGTHFSTSQTSPVRIDGFKFAAVVAGGRCNIGVLTNGDVVVWGYNNVAQLGDGTQTRRTVPTKHSFLSDLYTLSMGGIHTLVASRNGLVYGFGNNQNGKLGDGTTFDRINPARITALE